ncbi:helix-turn-helix domain-containing protein [Pseudomonas sp. 5P_5.1_Bac1]|uniref:helix-turn-helix domain-containing protein n=1 Tax=Pseudomonas sp. 5P_5.1_Bac1 TaxID=2971616 RepID=UPI0021C68225|nr:helix-turn-helix domain-containing protein [Pseudomonas sp. 5P_5.1_Bac1]MCU1721622.1 helix-turn-helix domain-containing protein [Pseudomonas sp. 5P_5.1_Bac1]
MTMTLDDLMDSFSPERRAWVEEKTRELVREELTLQALRRQLEVTQESLAERMAMGQANVSKVEKRSDMLISTLRGYVEALGGTLELVACMPGRGPVKLQGFSDSPPNAE